MKYFMEDMLDILYFIDFNWIFVTDMCILLKIVQMYSIDILLRRSDHKYLDWYRL